MKITGNWKKQGSVSVYERKDGFRIHLYGTVRKVCGFTFRVSELELLPYLRIQGWNRKRALMLWANQTFQEKKGGA